jgi:hypothetical protein
MNTAVNYISANQGIITIGLFFVISELMAISPKIKSNSIAQLILKILGGEIKPIQKPIPFEPKISTPIINEIVKSEIEKVQESVINTVNTEPETN